MSLSLSSVVVAVIIVVVVRVSCASNVLTIVFLLPMTTYIDDENDGTNIIVGILAAVKNAQALLPGYDLSQWRLIDTHCNMRETFLELKAIDEAVRDKHGIIDAIVGPSCADICNAVALLAGAWKVPHFGIGCVDESFVNPKIDLYPTFIRLAGSVANLIPTFVAQFIELYHISKLAIVSSPKNHFMEVMSNKLLESLNVRFLNSVQVRTFQVGRYSLYGEGLGSSHAELVHILSTLREDGFNAFFLATTKTDTEFIVQMADAMGFNSRESLFLTTRYFVDERESFEDENSRQKKSDLFGLISFNYRFPDSARYRAFVAEVSNVDSAYNDPRLRKYKPEEKHVQPHWEAAFIYDSLELWARAVRDISKTRTVRQTSEEDDDNINGSKVVEFMSMDSFEGLTGRISIANRYRPLDYSVMLVYDKDNQILGTYSQKEKALKMNSSALHNLSLSRGQIDTSGKELFIIILCSVAGFVLIVAVALIVLVCFFRKFRKDMEMERTLAWLIHWEEITLATTTRGPRLHPVVSELSFAGKSMSRVSAASGSVMTDFKSFEGLGLDERTKFGYYQDKKIVIRMSNLETVDVKDQKLRSEFIKIRKLRHQNLNNFVSACVDPMHICTCMAYCPKGSIWDVIERRSFSMTWHLRMALAVDIAKGMVYLHESKVGSHGHLSSTNCVIDSRWTCKVTDYGLCYLRRSHLSNPQNISEDDRYYLWTAPELLRMTPQKRPLCGTKCGDVFAYGIVLQEICFQQKPYGVYLEDHGASDIVSHVKLDRDPVFRPEEPEDKSEMPGDTGKYSSKWMDLMRQCWTEKCEDRPQFKKILYSLQRISGGQAIHTIDNMVKMLEIHTVHLENIVHERSQELYEQKQKAVTLLYSILPKVVAEQLKQGGKVMPEHFEAVTVFVSDIVKFTPLAAASTPNQIVTFLGMLYNMFDETVDRNDVYKVETIGDAYLAASGLPMRNGNAHASEIATFALQILDAIHDFKIPHMPEKVLEVRIGVHTGPVLAGVVGHKMPRYCLFGHTVSIAYLMEENSPANCVLVSDKANELLSETGQYRVIEHSKVETEKNEIIQTYQLLGKVTRTTSNAEASKRRASFSGRLPSAAAAAAALAAGTTAAPAAAPSTAAASASATGDSAPSSDELATRRPSLIGRIFSQIDFRTRRPSLPEKLS